MPVRLALALTFALAAGPVVGADSIIGPARVVDGDTIELLTAGATLMITGHNSDLGPTFGKDR